MLHRSFTVATAAAWGVLSWSALHLFVNPNGTGVIASSGASSTSVNDDADADADRDHLLDPALRRLQGCDSCVSPIPFLPSRHKRKYKVGVLGIRGNETAFSQYNATFGTYLTATAGRRFDPPIEFEMEYLDFQTMYDWTRDELIDFTFVSPSPSACIEAEYGAQSLVSYTSQEVVDGVTNHLSEFGGLIITLKENDAIRTIHDLKDKVIGVVSIAGFGAALLQFHEMQKAGMSYINDPAQLVFTANQGDIVRGVLDGTFDAGFVRTGLIERTVDSNGNPVDGSRLKILQARQDETDGVLFPYKHSTPLYPEWNLASLRHVSSDVAREVQAALLALDDHARTGQAVEECLANADREHGVWIANASQSHCNDPLRLDPYARCDTTSEVATVAQHALTTGGYAGFRTTLSYNSVRGLLQDTGFIVQDSDTNVWRCTRPAELFDSIICPTGFFKKPRKIFDELCDKAGLECGEGYQCACKPCFAASDIEVAPTATYEIGSGCKKMSICGSVQQTNSISFSIIDNKKRDGLNFSVRILEGNTEKTVTALQGDSPDTFLVELSPHRVGIVILQIFQGDEQIEASPLRLEVLKRDCSEDYKGERREPNEVGECVCQVNTILLLGKCVPKSIFFVIIIVPPIVIAVAVAIFIFVDRKQKEADSLWRVHEDDVHYQCPPVVLGRGSFGLVLQAEYRGAKVAVKRVLPSDSTDLEKSQEREAIFAGSQRTLSIKRMDFTDSASHSDGLDIPLDDVPRSRPERSRESVNDIEMNVSSRRSVNSQSARVQLASSFTVPVKTNRETTAMKENDRSARFSVSFGDMPSPVMSTKKRGKVAANKRSREALKKEFIMEMRLISRLRHPNITTVMGAVLPRGNRDALLLMEWMEHGSLLEVIHNPTIVLEGNQLLEIIKDVTHGVRFLHSSDPPIIHGDIKPSNILIDSKFRAKLSDFGLSKIRPGQATGTPLWMAPELLRGETPNSSAADMYALGIVLYELYSRQEPYEESPLSDDELLKEICDKKINRRPAIPTEFPKKVAKLMKFLWHADPAQRPTAKELENRLEDMDASVMHQVGVRRQSVEQIKIFQEDFLYQAFPRHVADILKDGGKVEPESHDMVTIFFSDVVGFTSIASSMPPIKVSNMLDRLYLKFDELSTRFNLFKIETIGDAYMCAANLATIQEYDHVKRIAYFAKRAIEAASETLIDEENPDLGYVQIRVGFHSGPVVSSVVGSLNPRYGLFGDTVNVASRMESLSETGRVHCSKRSADMLRRQAPELKVTLRGEKNVKGRGTMITYWVDYD